MADGLAGAAGEQATSPAATAINGIARLRRRTRPATFNFNSCPPLHASRQDTQKPLSQYCPPHRTATDDWIRSRRRISSLRGSYPGLLHSRPPTVYCQHDVRPQIVQRSSLFGGTTVDSVGRDADAPVSSTALDGASRGSVATLAAIDLSLALTLARSSIAVATLRLPVHFVLEMPARFRSLAARRHHLASVPLSRHLEARSPLPQTHPADELGHARKAEAMVSGQCAGIHGQQ